MLHAAFLQPSIKSELGGGRGQTRRRGGNPTLLNEEGIQMNLKLDLALQVVLLSARG